MNKLPTGKKQKSFILFKNSLLGTLTNQLHKPNNVLQCHVQICHNISNLPNYMSF